MTERLHLDHVGHVVADLAAAARLYGRLGFALMPVSHHRTPGPDGGMVPGGTANQCAMLGQGYLELLAITDRTAPTFSARENAAFLDRFEGLHLLAIGTLDAAATRARLVAAGVAFSARDLGRMVEGPEGPAEARFRLTPVEPLSDANQTFFFIEHLTRQRVWPAGSTRHPNGARGLRELVMVAADPAPLALRLDRALGRGARQAGGAWIWELSASRLVVATPEGADARLGAPVARRDGAHAAGLAVEVDDLGAVERLLQRNAVPFRRHEGRLTVAPADGLGTAIQFCGGEG
ncbi:MAG: VOC family protein [Rhodobacteraceae bacterium]|nr:VOC family protein [Paracoccaceae bacterium]